MCEFSLRDVLHRLYWHPFEKNCKLTRNYIDYYVLSSHHYYYYHHSCCVCVCVCVSSSATEASQSLISPDCVEFQIKFKMKKKKTAKSIFGCASCHAFNYCVNPFFSPFRNFVRAVVIVRWLYCVHITHRHNNNRRKSFHLCACNN